jgi:integrase/recombinase XerD
MAWTLRKRGRVYWANRTVKGVRERRTTECTDRKAAELVIQRWEREDADPRHRAAYQTTLRSALDRLITDRETVRSRAKGTVQMYVDKASHVARVLGAETALAEIGAAEVDRFIDTRLAEGAARSTIGKELTALRAALKIAKRRGEFDKDVTDVMPIGWSNDYTPRKTFLTPEQVGALFDQLAIDHSTRARIDGVQQRLRLHRVAHVAFILATGVRWEESVRAERQDVDTDAWSVAVRGTKTDLSEATISVSPLGRALLRLALDNAPGGRTGRLFAPWASVRRDLAIACDRAKIPRVTPNDLRRTCASWFVQRGGSLFAASKILRHADTRMVSKVYAQLAGSDLRATLEREVGTTPIAVPMVCPTLTHSTESMDTTDTLTTRLLGENHDSSCPGTESNCRHADFQASHNHDGGSGKTGLSSTAQVVDVPIACPASRPADEAFGAVLDAALGLGGGS